MPVKPPSMYRCGAGGAHEKCSSGVRGPLPYSGHRRNGSWDLTNGPEVKTQPSQVRGERCGGMGMGLIPSLGTKSPPAMGQPSLCATARENCKPNKQSPMLKVDTIQPNK